jgi:hypothetical protein
MAGLQWAREMFCAWYPDQPEITDLIVQHDPHTYPRVAVRKQDVLDVFLRFGNRQALRAVRTMPEKDGVLDNRKIDAVLVRVHRDGKILISQV